MKKIKVIDKENLEAVLRELKGMDYTYILSPSLNVKYILIKDKKIRFEYGEDVYPEYKLVTIEEFVSGLKGGCEKKDTSSYFDKIQQGFKKLQEDCTDVRLVGFCQKEDIPSEAHREEFEEKEVFDHEYQLTRSDGYDEAGFWGYIYLQLDGTLYMRFDVIG